MASYTQAALNTVEGGPDNINELKAFVESKVAHSISTDELENLFRVQGELRSFQRTLADEFRNDRIPKEYYYKRVNEAFSKFMHESLNILGSEDFSKVYGDEDWDIAGIIDPEIFFSEEVDGHDK